MPLIVLKFCCVVKHDFCSVFFTCVMFNPIRFYPFVFNLPECKLIVFSICSSYAISFIWTCTFVLIWLHQCICVYTMCLLVLLLWQCKLIHYATPLQWFIICLNVIACAEILFLFKENDLCNELYNYIVIFNPILFYPCAFAYIVPECQLIVLSICS